MGIGHLPAERGALRPSELPAPSPGGDASRFAPLANSPVESTWSIVPSPSPTAEDTLSDVTCVDAAECWAVGYTGVSLNSASSPADPPQAFTLEGTSSGWTVVSAAASSTDTALSGVTCVSSTDCWAVGSYADWDNTNGTYYGYATLIEQWTGSAWVIVTSPDPGILATLSGVACVDADHCWAVGTYNTGSGYATLIEQWNGSTWTEATSPSPSNDDGLSGVSCPGAGDCWAVGQYVATAGEETLAEQLSDGAWTVVASPNPSTVATLSSVTCVSSSSCWAVGYQYDGGDQLTLAEQYAAGVWSIIATVNPNAAEDILFGVACVSADSCWAVGADYATSGLIEQWDGGSSWTVSTSPAAGALASLAGVACLSTGDCWAVGEAGGTLVEATAPPQGPWTATIAVGGSLYADTCVAADDCWAVGSSADGTATLVERNTGDGWGTVPSPNPPGATLIDLNGVSCADASDCWAVGDYTNDSGVSQTLIEQYNGSTWSITGSTTQGIDVQDSWFYGVTCASSTECWVVGQYEDSGGYFHPLLGADDGNGWSVSAPSYGNLLSAVTCVSGDDCWAVGNFYDTDDQFQTLTYEYTGTWSQVAAPDVGGSDVYNTLNAVVCGGASECWAVGLSDAPEEYNQSLIEEFNGSDWAIVSSPDPGGADNLEGVACASASDCWAIGYYYPLPVVSTDYQTLTDNLEFGSWETVASADVSGEDALWDVTCDGTVNCWAVGDSYSDGTYQSLIEQSVQADSPPMVTSLTPAAGPVAGGQTVTVSGYGFPTDESLSATLGGVAVTPANVTSTSFTFTTPAASAGSVYLQATDVYGSSLEDSNAAYAYVPPPDVTSVTPSSGTSRGGQLVTIGGTGFEAGATVEFGSSQARTVQFINSTQLTAVTPAGTAGTVDVTVTNPVGGSSTDPSAYTYAGSAPPPTAYAALSPYRICDTRSVAVTGYGTECSGHPLGQGQTLDVQITGVDGYVGQSVPADAQSVVLNVTAISGSATTYLTVFPAGSAPPNASNLNVTSAINQANLVVVALGTGGQVGIYNSAGTINVAVDVEGYFAPASGSSSGPGLFHPIAPLRICDTRQGSGTACSGDSLGQGQWEKVVVSGCPTGAPSCTASVPTSDAASVALNLTAVMGTASTFLSVVPPSTSDQCPTSAPGYSNVNVPAKDDLPNRVIVPLGPDQDVCVYNSAGTINFVLDINGWFGNGSESSPGASFYAVSPTRICDTRSTSVTGYGTECSGDTLGQGSTLTIPVAGVDGLPAAGGSSPVVAMIANVTAVSGTADTYFTLYPADMAQPNASDLNVDPGQITPNLVIVQLATTGGQAGDVHLFNDQGSINAIVDIAGWFQ